MAPVGRRAPSREGAPSQSAPTDPVGHERGGKSTFTKALQVGTSAKSLGYEATQQLDMQTLVLGDSEKQVRLNVWDFAGGPDYAGGIMHYLVPGSLYVLAVPAVDLKLLKANSQNWVGRWLDYLELGAPEAIVVPVLMSKC